MPSASARSIQQLQGRWPDGITAGTAEGGKRRLFGWAAAKVAGGVCVDHRVGVVDVEDQDKVERVGADGEGFVQDAVSPDVFEADAVQLVLVEVVGRDRPGGSALTMWRG
jgi:hypothetical protein